MTDDEHERDDAGPSAEDLAELGDEKTDLARCPACGADVYENANRCCTCGQYITPQPQQRSWTKWIAMAVLVLMAALLAWAFLR